MLRDRCRSRAQSRPPFAYGSRCRRPAQRARSRNPPTIPARTRREGGHWRDVTDIRWRTPRRGYVGVRLTFHSPDGVKGG
eukprot:6175751-Pleurochrysis_carterae.AAC.4